MRQVTRSARFGAYLLFSCSLLCAGGPASEVARAQRRAAGTATRPSSVVLPNEPTVTRLPNGLTVVTTRWGGADDAAGSGSGIVAYYTLVRTGSRDEVEAGHSGFAHFFEHMMFRGTERYPAHAYEQVIQSLGADNNAYTDNDVTVYHVTGPSSALSQIVDLEADRFQHLQYAEPEFRTEAGAVRGEYDKSAADPGLKMEEALMELAFQRHTYRHTVIGYLADVERMPEEFAYSRDFFSRYYTPDNCVVIVVGDVDEAETLRLVREKYGSWQGRRARPTIPREAEPTEGADRHIEWPSEIAPRILMGYRTPSFDGGLTGARRDAALRETAALELLHLLLFSPSARLYQRLMVDDPKVNDLGSYQGSFRKDPFLFGIYATLRDGTQFPEVVDAIQEEIAAITQAGRSPELLERVRNAQSHLRYSAAMHVETPSQAANLIAGLLGVTADVGGIDAWFRAIERVTPQDVVSVARKYLTPNRRFVVTASSPRAQGAGQ